MSFSSSVPKAILFLSRLSSFRLILISTFWFDSAVLLPMQSIELLRTRCRSVLNRPSREEIPNGYEVSAGNCTRSQSTFRVVLSVHYCSIVCRKVEGGSWWSQGFTPRGSCSLKPKPILGIVEPPHLQCLCVCYWRCARLRQVS